MNETEMATEIERLSAALLGARTDGDGLPLSVPAPKLAPRPTSVEPGQVWRARWDDVLALVLVDSVLGDVQNGVRVAPLTIGEDDADDSAVVLPPSSSSLQTAVSIWPEFVSEIAEVVLEHWVTDLVKGFSTLQLIDAALERGEVHRGLPILNPDSPRIQEKKLLGLLMEALISATKLASGNGSLPEMIANAGIAVTLLAKAANVDNPTALKIRRGELGVDLNQARALSPLLDRDPVEILQGNPELPMGLLTKVTTLIRGPQVRMLAVVMKVPEAEAFEQMTRGSFALAARGEKIGPKWDERVDRFLQSWLDDERQP